MFHPGTETESTARFSSSLPSQAQDASKSRDNESVYQRRRILYNLPVDGRSWRTDRSAGTDTESNVANKD
jgi:hypothetical protein